LQQDGGEPGTLILLQSIRHPGDDLSIGSFTVNGVQRGIDQIVKYCGDWNLKCNLKKKPKYWFLRKGGN
jgi:hypothetical protein